MEKKNNKLIEEIENILNTQEKTLARNDLRIC